MDYASLEQLHVNVEDGIAVVTFDPVQEGPVEPSFFTNLRDVFPLLSVDPSVRAVVLTGGDDVFFTGTGLGRTVELVRAGLQPTMYSLMTLKQIIEQIVGFRKPVVAAVNGAAPNVGGVIALSCDAVIVVEGLAFGDNHVANGQPAGDGGTMLWPMLVGLPAARRILLRGRQLEAQEALAMGLVDEVVEPGHAVARAIETAGELASLPQLAFVATKQALGNWWRFASLLSWDVALAAEGAVLVSPEVRARLEAELDQATGG
jgi:enoyl-CoA hydratase